ncbi:MAG TPA: sulfotransferase [Gaiellaceae bacterium]|nr:sulfotransferase [Gaiellaceae bacterium]
MLRVVGAGLPRTATRSLKDALERLLGERCYHMAEVFQHLEDVPTWREATRGDEVDWRSFPPDCIAAVDWPASAFWRELADANPDALIVLSTRDSAAEGWESADETIFPILRKPVEQPENEEWQQMVLELAAREIGPDWDDAGRAQAFYELHNEQVRREAPAERLLDWRAADGWEPLCDALGVPVPDEPFPRVNTREEWRSRS